MPGSNDTLAAAGSGRWQSFLRDCRDLAEQTNPILVSGRLTRVAGLVMEATGLRLAVGSECTVLLPNGNTVDAEVVGFSGDKLFLMPANEVYGLVPGAKVIPVEVVQPRPSSKANQSPRRRAVDRGKHIPVGNGLLGRVLDGTGRPLDRLGPVISERSASLQNRPFNPLERPPITQPLDVGVRS
ncbi:MAG: flagellum-specific ATP synthase FliI, partial [Proteobacteria bacterium]|nr:flagellum-specific ATP synthase FliI [Pseudomonadota bacterium]